MTKTLQTRIEEKLNYLETTQLPEHEKTFYIKVCALFISRYEGEKFSEYITRLKKVEYEKQ